MLYNLERVNGSTGLCQNGIAPKVRQNVEMQVTESEGNGSLLA